MMVPEFKTMRADALKAETRIMLEIDELNNDLKTKKDDLAKARRILKELPVEETVKNSAGKAEVVEVAIEVLSEERLEPLTLEGLKKGCKERLKKKGFDVVGCFRYFPRYVEECEAITKTESGFYGLAAGMSKVA